MANKFSELEDKKEESSKLKITYCHNVIDFNI